MALKFYEAVMSSAAFRVRIALTLKGLKYESTVFDLRAKEHLTGDYGRVSPLYTVPALVDDGVPLVESMAICEYLAARHGSDLFVAPDEPDRPQPRSPAGSTPA